MYHLRSLSLFLVLGYYFGSPISCLNIFLAISVLSYLAKLYHLIIIREDSPTGIPVCLQVAHQLRHAYILHQLPDKPQAGAKSPQ